MLLPQYTYLNSPNEVPIVPIGVSRSSACDVYVYLFQMMGIFLQDTLFLQDFFAKVKDNSSSLASFQRWTTMHHRCHSTVHAQEHAITNTYRYTKKRYATSTDIQTNDIHIIFFYIYIVFVTFEKNSNVFMCTHIQDMLMRNMQTFMAHTSESCHVGLTLQVYLRAHIWICRHLQGTSHGTYKWVT